MTKNEFPMENLNWAIFKKHLRNIVGWKYENIKKQLGSTQNFMFLIRKKVQVNLIFQIGFTLFWF